MCNVIQTAGDKTREELPHSKKNYLALLHMSSQHLSTLLHRTSDMVSPVNQDPYPPGTCRVCQLITLAGLRDTFTSPRAVEPPDSVFLTYPDIKQSSESCLLCELILGQIRSEYNIPNSPITIICWTEYWPSRPVECGPDNLTLVDVVMEVVENEEDEYRSGGEEDDHGLSKWQESMAVEDQESEMAENEEKVIVESPFPLRPCKLTLSADEGMY